MTKEQLCAAKKLDALIQNNTEVLEKLKNGCALNIAGNYVEESDPEVADAMRSAAISVYADRIRVLQKAMSEL